MSRVRLFSGEEYDMVTPDELDRRMSTHTERIMDTLIREQIRGIKPVRGVGTGATVGSGVAVVIPGPQAGYVRSFLRISTVANSATSYDLFIVNDPSEGNTGNNFVIGIATVTSMTLFPKGTLLLNEGQSLIWFTNVGQTITSAWQAVDVPAEMVGKLYI